MGNTHFWPKAWDVSTQILLPFGVTYLVFDLSVYFFAIDLKHLFGGYISDPMVAVLIGFAGLRTASIGNNHVSCRDRAPISANWKRNK